MLRARFDGRVLVPLDPVDLPVGAELDIEILGCADAPTPQRGSPQALLRAMNAPSMPQPGDIEALEPAMEEGKMPIRAAGEFDETDQT